MASGEVVLQAMMMVRGDEVAPVRLAELQAAVVGGGGNGIGTACVGVGGGARRRRRCEAAPRTRASVEEWGGAVAGERRRGRRWWSTRASGSRGERPRSRTWGGSGKRGKWGWDRARVSVRGIRGVGWAAVGGPAGPAWSAEPTGPRGPVVGGGGLVACWAEAQGARGVLLFFFFCLVFCFLYYIFISLF